MLAVMAFKNRHAAVAALPFAVAARAGADLKPLQPHGKAELIAQVASQCIAMKVSGYAVLTRPTGLHRVSKQGSWCRTT